MHTFAPYGPSDQMYSQRCAMARVTGMPRRDVARLGRTARALRPPIEERPSGVARELLAACTAPSQGKRHAMVTQYWRAAGQRRPARLDVLGTGALMIFFLEDPARASSPRDAPSVCGCGTQRARVIRSLYHVVNTSRPHKPTQHGGAASALPAS